MSGSAINRAEALPFQVPKLLGSRQRPTPSSHGVEAAAEAAHLQPIVLPVRAPERTVGWLAALAPFDRLLKSGLFSAKFQWLSTEANLVSLQLRTNFYDTKL